MPLDELSATGLLTGFPEPMLVIDPEGTLLYMNPAAEALLETPGGADKGLITEFLPETERTRLDPLAWLKRWADTPDAPETDYVHLRVKTRGGRELPARVRVARFSADGEPVYVVMLQDASRVLQRAQSERDQHRLAARVLAITADAIVTVDPALTIAYANPSAERLFAYGSGELTGQPLAVLLPERFRAPHPGQIARFAAEAPASRLMGERSEVVGLSRSGEELPLEASITKVTVGQDVYFSAHLRDLRPRRAADAQLARTRASLQIVFEHALQAMALIDGQGLVLEMNGAARSLLPDGTDPIGRAFSALPFWASDPANTARWLEDAVGRCQAGESYRTTTDIQLPDGSQRSMDFSLTPVLVSDETIAIVAEARITEPAQASGGQGS